MEPGLARLLFPGAGKSDSSSRGPSSLLSPSPNANAKFQRTDLGTEPSRLEQPSWGPGGWCIGVGRGILGSQDCAKRVHKASSLLASKCESYLPDDTSVPSRIVSAVFPAPSTMAGPKPATKNYLRDGVGGSQCEATQKSRKQEPELEVH